VTPPEQGADVPVLTQVVEDFPAASAPIRSLDAGALDALALELERALLERLGPEVERVTARAFDKVRAELTLSVLQMVRDAVAASVSKELALPKRD
jgi:hypothetical protein